MTLVELSPTGPGASSRSPYRAARRDGARAGVTCLYSWSSAAAPMYGTRGHAVAPAGLPAPGATVVPLVPLLGSGLVALRGPASSPPSSRWVAAVLWARLGVSARLLDHCVAHLGRRTVGESTLLTTPLVKAALSDAGMAQVEVRSALLAAGQALSLGLSADLHGLITQADRALLPLMGAAGFTEAGPGWEVYVSELLADVYHPADREDSCHARDE